MKELYGYDYAKTCPLIYALTVVGARWKLPIVWYLTEEDGLHYNAIYCWGEEHFALTEKP